MRKILFGLVIILAFGTTAMAKDIASSVNVVTISENDMKTVIQQMVREAVTDMAHVQNDNAANDRVSRQFDNQPMRLFGAGGKINWLCFAFFVIYFMCIVLPSSMASCYGSCYMKSKRNRDCAILGIFLLAALVSTIIGFLYY